MNSVTEAAWDEARNHAYSERRTNRGYEVQPEIFREIIDHVKDKSDGEPDRLRLIVVDEASGRGQLFIMGWIRILSKGKAERVIYCYVESGEEFTAKIQEVRGLGRIV